MTINKTFIFILFSSLCLTLTGCGGDDDDFSNSGSGSSTPTSNTPTTPDSSDEDTETKKDTLSIDARPTDWIRVETNLNPTVSYQMVIAQPDLSQYAVPTDSGSWEDDLMATFVDGTCRGVSSPFLNDSNEGPTIENIIFMPTLVALTTDDADANMTVTIKYYSARLRHIFTATSPYSLKSTTEEASKTNSYGSRTNPLSLTWNK